MKQSRNLSNSTDTIENGQLMPDIAKVLQELGDLKTAMPTIINGVLDQRDFLSKDDVESLIDKKINGELKKYTPSDEINKTLTDGFHDITGQLDEAVSALNTTMMAQQATLNQHGLSIISNTEGDDRQQQLIADLIANQKLLAANQPQIIKQAETDRNVVNRLRSTLEVIEKDILEFRASVARANLGLLEVQKTNAKLLSENVELRAWHIKHDNDKLEEAKQREQDAAAEAIRIQERNEKWIKRGWQAIRALLIGTPIGTALIALLSGG